MTNNKDKCKDKKNNINCKKKDWINYKDKIIDGRQYNNIKIN